ncbi:MAG: hypothetical protein IH612_16105 [Desulfofustis sp.]|nr:hypothetical protein [Desulfofustis sp.]
MHHSAPAALQPLRPVAPGSIRPELIGFDFDGVIADIGEAFIRIACRDYGYCSITAEDICSFQLEQCLPIDAAIVESIFAAILDDSIGIGLKPIAGAITTLTRLSRLAPVVIITARPEQGPVLDWLELHCPPQTLRRIELIVTGDHDNKESFIRGCGLHHFLDDRARTCRQLAEAGLEPIVYSQPWNRNRHELPSVADWEELAGLLDFTGLEP